MPSLLKYSPGKEKELVLSGSLFNSADVENLLAGLEHVQPERITPIFSVINSLIILELDEAMLRRIYGGLHTFGEIKLAKNALHMDFDGGFRQAEHAGNFLVA